MRRFGGFLIAVAACAQAPAPTKSGALEARLQAGNLAGGVPQEFLFLPINASDRGIRLPMPAIECQDAYNGEIQLDLSLTADPLRNLRRGGCADRGGPRPPVTEIVKDWRTLRAGDTLTLKGDRYFVHYDDTQPGKYGYWVPILLPTLPTTSKRRCATWASSSPIVDR